MYSFVDTTQSQRLNEMLDNATRTVCTFILMFDSTKSRLKSYREAEMFFHDHGRADKDFHRNPVLLVGAGDSNRVFIKLASGHFADITNATDKEADDIALGVIAPPAPARASRGGFFDILFGMSAASSFEN